MTTPLLSAPVLLSPAQVRSNPRLTSQIINLANAAFQRSKVPDPVKWNQGPGRRFPTRESYHDMLVEGTTVAVIFDRNAKKEDIHDSFGDEHAIGPQSEDGSLRGKVVACGATTPWTGGWAKEGAGKETGFEIKAIAVEADERYLRKGLAVQLMAALEERLVEEARERLRGCSATDVVKERAEQQGTLALWIMAAECIAGPYWRRRGYSEVRRTAEGNGTWGCKTSFDLLVLRKDVVFAV
jgi:GNAT superfamily N-acetyltransferase